MHPKMYLLSATTAISYMVRVLLPATPSIYGGTIYGVRIFLHVVRNFVTVLQLYTLSVEKIPVVLRPVM